MKKRNIAALLLGVTAAAGAGESIYFYRRTMKRGKAQTDRTIKMSGTDWSQYSDFIAGCREKLLSRSNEDIYVESKDGLKLHATYFPQGEEQKVALCFHGYTGEGMKDNLAISNAYFQLLS